MPRTARKKDKKNPQHLMSRSIPELDLFRSDEDKDYYTRLMKTASQVYRITIIAYCLMDNHVHLLVHPNGGDISKFMKNINNTYAKYYNRTYGRSGHLYRDRFKNIIIKDEVQLIRTSTYIHHNPKVLIGKRYKSIESYPFSSLGIYLSPRTGNELADPSYVFKFMSGDGPSVRNHYRVLMEHQSLSHDSFEKELEEAFNKGEYSNDKEPILRNIEPDKILTTLARLIGEEKVDLAANKYRRETITYKSLAAICLRIFCDMTIHDLKLYYKGYTSAGIGHLSQKGYKIMEEKGLYRKMIEALQ